LFCLSQLVFIPCKVNDDVVDEEAEREKEPRRRRTEEFLAKAKRREKHKNNDSFKLALDDAVVVDCALCGAFKAARHVIFRKRNCCAKGSRNHLIFYCRRCEPTRRHPRDSLDKI
jgi:hypothetical protein